MPMPWSLDLDARPTVPSAVARAVERRVTTGRARSTSPRSRAGWPPPTRAGGGRPTTVTRSATRARPRPRCERSSAAGRIRSAASSSTSCTEHRLADRRSPRLDAAELEQVVDGAADPERLVHHPLGQPAGDLRVVLAEERLGQQAERADRRLQLVADVGHEVAADGLEPARSETSSTTTSAAGAGSRPRRAARPAPRAPAAAARTGRGCGVVRLPVDGVGDELVDGRLDEGLAVAGARNRGRGSLRKTIAPVRSPMTTPCGMASRASPQRGRTSDGGRTTRERSRSRSTRWSSARSTAARRRRSSATTRAARPARAPRPRTDDRRPTTSEADSASAPLPAASRSTAPLDRLGDRLPVGGPDAGEQA